MNFFNVGEEFFVIDSNNFSTTKSQFYGYMVQENGIFDKTNIKLLKPEKLSGCGAYVYVDASSKRESGD